MQRQSTFRRAWEASSKRELVHSQHMSYDSNMMTLGNWWAVTSSSNRLSLRCRRQDCNSAATPNSFKSNSAGTRYFVVYLKEEMR
jgi:hypothetical protein